MSRNIPLCLLWVQRVPLCHPVSPGFSQWFHSTSSLTAFPPQKCVGPPKTHLDFFWCFKEVFPPPPRVPPPVPMGPPAQTVVEKTIPLVFIIPPIPSITRAIVLNIGHTKYQSPRAKLHYLGSTPLSPFTIRGQSKYLSIIITP